MSFFLAATDAALLLAKGHCQPTEFRELTPQHRVETGIGCGQGADPRVADVLQVMGRQTLVAGQGDLPFDVVRAQVRSNLDLIVHAENTPNHGRRVVSITELIDEDPKELWRWSYRQGKHEKTTVRSCINDRLTKYGLELPN